MSMLAASPLMMMADASGAANSIRSYVVPILSTLEGLAALVCTIALIWGGYMYMTSSAEPQRLDHAKRILRNALIGFGIILAAAAATAMLHHAYTAPAPGATHSLPPLSEIQPKSADGGWATILIDALTGLFSMIITSLASPVLNWLASLTSSTPAMADQAAVFNMWLVILAISNGLFILVLALLGFRVMTSEMLGLGDIELRSLIPQIGLVFLLMNVSIFAIDAIIGLSNAIISAIYAGFPGTNIWKSLIEAMANIGNLGLVQLLLFVVFIVLAIMLAVYYIGRLIILFLGAALSPLVVLLWLLPGFRDFANNLIRTYLAVIFVLLVHVVILMLASSLLSEQSQAGLHIANPFTDTIIGVATILALIKTQGTLVQMSIVSSGANQTRKLGKQFANGMNYTAEKVAGYQLREAQSKYLVNVVATME